MKSLKISESLSLPIDAVTQVLALIGKRESGKSYCATKLAELMLTAKSQIVVIDGIGNWWGLRVAKNGKDKGFSIPVFGGRHGDVPLDVRSGTLIADLIIKGDYSAVIDVSMFRKNERKTFITDFIEQFFHLKKEHISPVHFFLEECQLYIPQKTFKGEERMLGAFEDLIKLGRNYGIGATLISQRPQAVNKDVLNQAECLFAFQMTGPHERKTIETWIRDKDINENISTELTRLPIGAPHIWSPRWLKFSGVVKIAEKLTLNSTSTPVVGEKQVEVKQLSPVDIEQLSKALSTVIEEHKENDPKVLKKRIQELQQELKLEKDEAKRNKILLEQKIEFAERRILENQKETEKRIAEYGNQKKIDTAQIPALENLLKNTELSISRLEEVWKGINKQVTGQLNSIKLDVELIGMDLSKLIESIGQNYHIELSKEVKEKPLIEYVDEHSFLNKDSKNLHKMPVSTDATDELSKGERLVLTLVAQQNGRCTRDMVTVFTEYKASTRNAYIQRLQQKGFIEFTGKNIKITESGATALGSYQKLPTGKALQNHWITNLPEGESKIFSVIIDWYPNSVERSLLADIFKDQYKTSTRNAYIQRLETKSLIHKSGSSGLKASSYLF